MLYYISWICCNLTVPRTYSVILPEAYMHFRASGSISVIYFLFPLLRTNICSATPDADSNCPEPPRAPWKVCWNCRKLSEYCRTSQDPRVTMISRPIYAEYVIPDPDVSCTMTAYRLYVAGNRWCGRRGAINSYDHCAHGWRRTNKNPWLYQVM